ncbi:hypothetical protein [Rathayibacter tritici]|uniref:hypothetical protein n=1 Tax=Rathayibacter tritici TaxID=33888 RepID=UPI0011B0BA3F|nr:hypothetical protein [Rathayibacter tritici]
MDTGKRINAVHQEPYSFGHIGGSASGAIVRQGESGATRVEMDILVDAIAIVANSRRRSPFRCLAFRKELDRIETYQLQVWPAELSYHCSNERNNMIDSYNAPTDEYVSGNERRKLALSQLLPEPLAARLAFPLNLPIWGRPSDGYRITGASLDGSNIVVHLQHQADSDVKGSMTVDTQKRLVTRFDTPTEVCWYENIEPGASHPT